MRRLGELLLEKGAIALSELHTALEACHRTGGRLGTHLLRFGFVDERALLEALSEQFGVPFVPESVLLRTAPAVLRCLPAEVELRLQAVPFDRLHNRLQVAMTNPRDPAALEELAAQTDRTLEPYVATETAVLKVLAELGEDFSMPAPGQAAAPRADDTWWEELWKPPRVGPGHLLRRQKPPRRGGGGRAFLATFPGLTPVAGVNLAEQPDLLDEETFVAELKEVRHRDQVGDLLVRFASRYLDRVCLFAIHRGRAVGWLGRGPGVVVDDVQSAEVGLDSHFRLREVAERGQAWVGPLPAGDEALTRLFSDPPAVEVVVVPVRVKDRTVAILVGDNPGEPTQTVSLPELQIVANRAGVAFEILILRTKIEV